MNSMFRLSVFIACFWVSAVNAAVIYDSFDYAAGSIAGASGGSNWSGNWTFETTQGTQQVVSEGLTFSDYETYGGALKLTEDNVTGTRSVAVRRMLGYDFEVGSDVWISFLAKSDGSLSNFTSKQAEIRHGTTVGATDLRMRPKGSGSQGVFIAYDGTSSNSASKNVQDGSTYLYICRFGDIGKDTGKYAVMWVFDEANYDLAMADGQLTEEDLNTYFYMQAQDTHANRTLDSTKGALINLVDSSTDSFSYYFDELRYGTSLSDVLAVPEPATIAILSFGAISVFMRRKRAA